MVRYFPKELLKGLEDSIHVMGRTRDDQKSYTTDFLIAGAGGGYVPSQAPSPHDIFVPVQALDEKNADQLEKILDHWEARQKGSLPDLQLAIEVDYYAAPLELPNTSKTTANMFAPLKPETLAPYIHGRVERMLVPELVKYAQEIINHNHTPPNDADDVFIDIAHIETAHDFMDAYNERRLTFQHTSDFIQQTRISVPLAERPPFLSDDNYKHLFIKATAEILTDGFVNHNCGLHELCVQKAAEAKSPTDFLKEAISAAITIWSDREWMKKSLLDAAKEARGDHFDCKTSNEDQLNEWTRYVLAAQFPMLGISLMQKPVHIIMLNQGLTVHEAERTAPPPTEEGKTWGHRKVKTRLEDTASVLVVGDENHGHTFPFNTKYKTRVLIHEVVHALNAQSSRMASDIMDENLIQRQDAAHVKHLAHQLGRNAPLKQEARDLTDEAMRRLPTGSDFAKSYFKNPQKPTAEEYRDLVQGIVHNVRHRVIELPKGLEAYEYDRKLYEHFGDARRMQDEQLAFLSDLTFSLCRSQDDLPGVMKFMKMMIPPVTMDVPGKGTRGNLTYGLEHFINQLQQQYEISVRFAAEKINVSKMEAPLLVTQDKNSYFLPTWQRFGGKEQITDLEASHGLPPIYPRSTPPVPVARLLAKKPDIETPPPVPYAAADGTSPKWQNYLDMREEKSTVELPQKNTDVPPRR